MPDTDLILDVLDIRSGKFAFAATCPDTNKVEFYVVPFKDIRVYTIDEKQYIKVTADCDCCHWVHDFIIWENG